MNRLQPGVRFALLGGAVAGVAVPAVVVAFDLPPRAIVGLSPPLVLVGTLASRLALRLAPVPPLDLRPPVESSLTSLFVGISLVVLAPAAWVAQAVVGGDAFTTVASVVYGAVGAVLSAAASRGLRVARLLREHGGLPPGPAPGE